MATKLNIDTGVKEYRINDTGVLRFNASDPNVYDRFMLAMDEIQNIETETVEKANSIGGDGRKVLALLREADLAIKAQLQRVFGAENDFDALLDGVNLMAVGANGERIVTNLIAALQPIVEEGLKGYTQGLADTAVASAKANRAQRRAAK